MVEKVFRGRVSDDLAEFLKIVVTKERYGSLKAIFAYFTELVRESEGMGTAYVSTAVELTKEQKQAVRESCFERLLISPLMCITMWIRH